MDGAIEARIVDIGVPLADNSYNYFTGYILSDGLILTCLHGFTDAPDYDSSSGITISSSSPSGFDIALPLNSACFDELVEEDGFFQYYCPEFSEKFDVVIFSCPAAKATNPQTLQKERFNDPGEWQAGGYPYFNRNNEATSGYKNFNGTFTVPGSAINLELKVLQPVLPQLDHWGCASGSPVFIKGELAGIIRRYTEYEAEEGGDVITAIVQHQLEASYLKKLWEEDPKFKAFFESQDAAKKVTKHVVSFLREPQNSCIRSAFGEDSPEQLVSRLQTTPLSGFLDEMSEVSGAPLAIKKQFTNSFVPFYFSDQALLIEESSSAATIDINCVKEIAAEFAMSAFSGREANVAYRGDASIRGGELYVSEGKQALAAMPESGIGKTGLDTAALAEDFNRRRALPDIVADQKRLSINSVSVENFVVSRLAPYMVGEHEENAFDEVNAALEKDSRKNTHYYLVVKIDKDSETGKQMLGQIEVYKKTFPNLFFINLAPSGMDERERLLHRELPALITE